MENVIEDVMGLCRPMKVNDVKVRRKGYEIK
jgi:hypothetical protein